MRLGLHRLRLEGELAEIRAGDLRFSLAEAGELFAAAGVELPGPAVAVLHERTEGWAAGLRLAALAAASHPDPERFAAGFSGTERTVAEYLLAEVLERQGDRMRRLLLRTSILDRLNGNWRDLLTGDEGAERALQDLEAANAFVTSLDGARSWFRFHQMFAGLLRLELRRNAPGEVAGLHRAAAGWLAGHGYPVEAVRQAQAAQDWDLAARLLAVHWPGLYLDGRTSAIHELVAGFPAGLTAADAELAVVAAADELACGSLETAERRLSLAERGLDGVPEAGQGQVRLLLAVVRLLLARQRGYLPTVTEAADQLRDMAERAGSDRVAPGLGADLSTLALISLGVTERWAAAHDDSKQHLERGIELARRIGRPYLEFTGLVHWATEMPRSIATEKPRSIVAETHYSRQAIELARRHGWTDDSAFGVACSTLGAALALQGRTNEAEPWVQCAERNVRTETEPAACLAICYVRGLLEQARGRDAAALAAFQAVEPLARQIASPQYLLPRARAQQVHSLVRLGQAERAGQLLDGLSEADRDHPEIRIAAAELRLAEDDPGAALSELTRVLDGPGGGRPGRARRPGRRRTRPGEGARSSRARRSAHSVPAVSGAGTAGAPPPAPYRARVSHRRDPQPVRGSRSRAAASLAGAAGRAAQRQRDPRAALPAHQPDRTRNRPRAVGLTEHGQDPYQEPVRQARHASPGRGRRARPRPGTARTPQRGPGHAGQPRIALKLTELRLGYLVK